MFLLSLMLPWDCRADNKYAVASAASQEARAHWENTSPDSQKEYNGQEKSSLAPPISQEGSSGHPTCQKDHSAPTVSCPLTEEPKGSTFWSHPLAKGYSLCEFCGGKVVVVVVVVATAMVMMTTTTTCCF